MSPTSPPPEFGLPLNAVEVTPARLTARLDDAKRIGITTIHTGVAWWYFCPTHDSCDFSRLDELVSAARARNLKVTMQIAGTPDWVHPHLTAPTADDRRWTMPQNEAEEAALTAFSQQVASRYRGTVSRYEIWNEPNLPAFSKPDIAPARYARVLAAGYRGIKQGDPNAQVVSAGLSRSDVGFATQLLSELAKLPDADQNNLFFDEFGIHPYSDSESPLASLGSKVRPGEFGQIDANFDGLSRISDLLDEHGRRDARIWLGEFGYSTAKTWMNAVPDERRGLFAQLAIDKVRRDRRISGMVWYAFLPNSGTGSEWSIMDPDGRPSKTFNAIAAELRSNSSMAGIASVNEAPRLFSGGPCPATPLSGRVSWNDSCLTTVNNGATSYDVLIDGVVAASGQGGVPELDTTVVPNGAHSLILAFYDASGPIGRTAESTVNISNPVRSTPAATQLVGSGTSARFTVETHVTADPAAHVDALTVAARDSAGNNFDFPGHYSGVTIPPSGLPLKLSRDLPPGTYTVWATYCIQGKWTDLPGKTTIQVR